MLVPYEKQNQIKNFSAAIGPVRCYGFVYTLRPAQFDPWCSFVNM